MFLLCVLTLICALGLTYCQPQPQSGGGNSGCSWWVCNSVNPKLPPIDTTSTTKPVVTSTKFRAPTTTKFAGTITTTTKPQVSKSDGDCLGGCGAPSYVGDGFCDDDNNNCGCDWDQGDCCEDSGKSKQFNYCSDCSCLDPDILSSIDDCSSGCGSENYFGDGFCDDYNNNCGCGWDGGDCCGDSGKNMQYNYCSDCACLDPDYTVPAKNKPSN